MIFRCDHCGAIFPHAAEQCPACEAFGTLLEYDAPAPVDAGGLSVGADAIEASHDRRVSTGFELWDDVLGGGVVVPSSLVVYGAQGTRKTTYTASIAHEIARRTRGAGLYLCPEMPTAQARDAAARMTPDVDLRFAGIERGADDFLRCAREI